MMQKASFCILPILLMFYMLPDLVVGEWHMGCSRSIQVKLLVMLCTKVRRLLLINDSKRETESHARKITYQDAPFSFFESTSPKLVGNDLNVWAYSIFCHQFE